jgi:hypothetical protein
VPTDVRTAPDRDDRADIARQGQLKRGSYVLEAEKARDSLSNTVRIRLILGFGDGADESAKIEFLRLMSRCGAHAIRSSKVVDECARPCAGAVDVARDLLGVGEARWR